MGLDMFAYAVVNAGQPNEASEEIAYWRKCNNLHGWMEDLWRARGGEGAFNCVRLKLEDGDLYTLEAALATPEQSLPGRSGFFFGPVGDMYPEDIEATRRFIATARERIASGFDIYYDSWW